MTTSREKVKEVDETATSHVFGMSVIIGVTVRSVRL